MKALVSDAQLLELNRLGIIPGPDETEGIFLDRAEACLRLSETLRIQPIEYLGVNANISTAPFLKVPLEESLELHGIAPDWVPLFFNNRGLAPWHGGCAWICENGSSNVAFLQLREPFARTSRYLLLYQRDELITHECSHIGRMAFEEPLFEEIIAFQSSSSPIRRWLGPILQSAREALLLFTILFLLLVFDIGLLIYPSKTGIEWALSLKLIPLSLIGFGLARLAILHNRFNSCLRNLETLLSDSQKARAVIYRLRDREIWKFSKLSAKDILHYAHEHGKKSLRWRLLLLAYF